MARSSTSLLLPGVRGSSRNPPYNVSKAGVISLTQGAGTGARSAQHQRERDMPRLAVDAYVGAHHRPRNAMTPNPGEKTPARTLRGKCSEDNSPRQGADARRHRQPCRLPSFRVRHEHNRPVDKRQRRPAHELGAGNQTLDRRVGAAGTRPPICEHEPSDDTTRKTSPSPTRLSSHDLLRNSAIFIRCMFDDAELPEIDAEQLHFEDCSLRRVNFFNLACDDLTIENSRLQGARFDKADIREATLRGCEFTSATFREARLNLSCIENCDMSLCNLDGANLFAADLTGSRFRTVDFSQARMDAVTIDNADFSMATVRFKRFVDGRLKGVNFTETDLSGTDFSGTVFEGCHLTGAVVTDQTRFDRADLRGAYISGSGLEVASLKGTVMSAQQASTLLFERFGIVVAES